MLLTVDHVDAGCGVAARRQSGIRAKSRAHRAENSQCPFPRRSRHHLKLESGMDGRADMSLGAFYKLGGPGRQHHSDCSGATCTSAPVVVGVGRWEGPSNLSFGHLMECPSPIEQKWSKDPIADGMRRLGGLFPVTSADA